METVLTARDLTRHYEVSRGLFKGHAQVRALNGVSFELEAGKTLAVVGESGCGKSTLARALTLIEEPTSGSLKIAGQEVKGASKDQRRQLRRDVQMVFQNPYASLNPRQKIGDQLAEPLLINTALSREERREKVQQMMRQVGLRPEHYQRYPHMFSGGQRQRIALARAMMLQPGAGGGRADLGPRRVDPGPGTEPVHGPAAAVPHRLRVHLAQPGGGPPCRRRRPGDVPRPTGGDGAGGQALREPAASLHPRAARRPRRSIRTRRSRRSASRANCRTR